MNIDEQVFQHRMKLERWLWQCLSDANVPVSDVTTRCQLRQHPGKIELFIDGKLHATREDVIL